MSHLRLHPKTSQEEPWLSSPARAREADASEPRPLILDGGLGWTEGADGRLQSATANDYVQEIERLRRRLIVAKQADSVLKQERAQLLAILKDISRQPPGDPAAQALAGEGLGLSILSREAPSHSELVRELWLAIEELRDLGLTMEADAHVQILRSEVPDSHDHGVDGDDGHRPM
jgi:hypothetical protein